MPKVTSLSTSGVVVERLFFAISLEKFLVKYFHSKKERSFVALRKITICSKLASRLNVRAEWAPIFVFSATAWINACRSLQRTTSIMQNQHRSLISCIQFLTISLTSIALKCIQISSEFLYSFHSVLTSLLPKRLEPPQTRRTLHKTKSFYTRITLYYTGSRTLKYDIDYRI